MLRAGVLLAVGSSAVLVGVGVFWGFPWQLLLLLVAGTIVLAGLLCAMSLPAVRLDARLRATGRDTLITWAGRNGGRYGTVPAEFVTGGKGWELPVSPLFRGELLAVGRREGVEVGIACSTVDVGEAGTAWHTTVLVRLPRERPPARLRRRETHHLDLPQRVESVETGGRALCVRYEGWPEGSLWLDARVDAAVRLAVSLPDT
ncbi:hypothetical protein [Streptomyces sp. NPDC052701]|uniref:hypothetical protein n=1 Tax=Streptomyces sp. NPDC052701 TaxID=3155533 RepID=UPI00341A6245